MLLRVCSAIPGLIVVSWLLIRPQPVQEPLFRCELASVNYHCGGASMLGGLPVGALALLAWQWYLSARAQQDNFQRLPLVIRGAIIVG